MQRRHLLQASALLAALAAAPLAARAGPIEPGPNAVLVVVDVQNCHVQGGSLPVPGGAEVVPVINRLAAAFDNIVVTQDWHPPDHASFASQHPGRRPFETVRLGYGLQVLWPDHCVQGSEDAGLHPELRLPTAQLILRKGFQRDVDSYSAFEAADRRTSTGLAGYLWTRRITDVYVVGLPTDFAVAWTALDARKAGFHVSVIEDATRPLDLEGSRAAAWKEMAAKGVRRIWSSGIAAPMPPAARPVSR